TSPIPAYDQFTPGRAGSVTRRTTIDPVPAPVAAAAKAAAQASATATAPRNERVQTRFTFVGPALTPPEFSKRQVRTLRRFERLETAAQERDHRVDRRRNLVGALRFRMLCAALLGQDVEGGGEGGGDDLRAQVVRGCVEVFRDCRGNQFLELGDSGSQVAAECLVIFDAETQLFVDVALLDFVEREDEPAHCLERVLAVWP